MVIAVPPPSPPKTASDPGWAARVSACSRDKGRRPAAGRLEASPPPPVPPPPPPPSSGPTWASDCKHSPAGGVRHRHSAAAGLGPRPTCRREPPAPFACGAERRSAAAKCRTGKRVGLGLCHVRTPASAGPRGRAPFKGGVGPAPPPLPQVVLSFQRRRRKVNELAPKAPEKAWGITTRSPAPTHQKVCRAPPPLTASQTNPQPPPPPPPPPIGKRKDGTPGTPRGLGPPDAVPLTSVAGAHLRNREAKAPKERPEGEASCRMTVAGRPRCRPGPPPWARQRRCSRNFLRRDIETPQRRAGFGGGEGGRWPRPRTRGTAAVIDVAAQAPPALTTETGLCSGDSCAVREGPGATAAEGVSQGTRDEGRGSACALAGAVGGGGGGTAFKRFGGSWRTADWLRPRCRPSRLGTP